MEITLNSEEVQGSLSTVAAAVVNIKGAEIGLETAGANDFGAFNGFEERGKEITVTLSNYSNEFQVSLRNIFTGIEAMKDMEADLKKKIDAIAENQKNKILPNTGQGGTRGFDK